MKYGPQPSIVPEKLEQVRKESGWSNPGDRSESEYNSKAAFEANNAVLLTRRIANFYRTHDWALSVTMVAVALACLGWTAYLVSRSAQ